jgi:hypothetical protein
MHTFGTRIEGWMRPRRRFAFSADEASPTMCVLKVHIRG